MKFITTLTCKVLLTSSMCIAAAQAAYINVHQDSLSIGASVMNMNEGGAIVSSDAYSGLGLLGGSGSVSTDYVSKYGSARYSSSSYGMFASVNTDDAPSYDSFNEEERALAGYLDSEVYVNLDTVFSMDGDSEFLYTMSTFGNTFNSSNAYEDWWSVELVDLTTQEVVLDSSDLSHNNFASMGDRTLFDGHEYSLSVSIYGYGDTHDDHPFFAIDFGPSAQVVAQATSVSEPSMIGLLLLAMSGLVIRRRSQQQAA